MPQTTATARQQKACGYEGCQNLTDAPSGLCKKCYSKKWYRDSKGADAKPKKKAKKSSAQSAPIKEVPPKWTKKVKSAKPAEGEASLATITVTEEHLNNFLLSLPLATKAELVSGYFSRPMVEA